MTTKPPAQVAESSPGSRERLAYDSVREIPTQEPNDRHRLGYHIWRWLVTGAGTLEDAVAESGARMLIRQSEAVEIIRKALNFSRAEGGPPSAS